MTIEEAIKKAIEGGWIQKDCGWQFDGYDPEWRPKVYFERFYGGDLQDKDVLLSEAFLDPSFWQSLGKALGWGAADERPRWEWHRFIDYLGAGKTAEEFFASL